MATPTPPRPTDCERIASRYNLAREAPTEWVGAWRVALAPLLRRLVLPMLDVGSGTGYWATALADWFSLEVVAVEPSRAMRREALEKRHHPAISYLGERAESLPLRDGSCDSAWFSTVVHHVSDLSRCALELRRVLAPGGQVVILNAFSGRTDGIPWPRYFEHVRHLAESRWPTVEQVLAAFEQRVQSRVSQPGRGDFCFEPGRVRTPVRSAGRLDSGGDLG